MEWRRGIGSPAAALAVACAVLAMIPEVSSVRYTVGGSSGWSSKANLTVWAQSIHFYNGDWLYFIYDRSQLSVLQVNQTNYESCNSNSFLHNYTTGAGRDVAPLNVTGPYYFISGNGFCYSGVKLAINVSNPPPPPSGSPVKSDSGFLTYTVRGQIVIPAVFAIAAVWDSFLRVW
ncbi:hypothetical protein RHGRI_028490 [Rhododendron griersonianum]|uniref:Phytocyanin domain-containing protein n=1 Tax=Rhododendron griersonianum TaxID=479676 RepID=A0AAV6II24_9ERIC|nr:hypothetical protein RHGRI_028490 [Rhododendron griersonianum]